MQLLCNYSSTMSEGFKIQVWISEYTLLVIESLKEILICIAMGSFAAQVNSLFNFAPFCHFLVILKWFLGQPCAGPGVGFQWYLCVPSNSGYSINSINFILSLFFHISVYLKVHRITYLIQISTEVIVAIHKKQFLISNQCRACGMDTDWKQLLVSRAAVPCIINHPWPQLKGWDASLLQKFRSRFETYQSSPYRGILCTTATWGSSFPPALGCTGGRNN